MSEWSNIEYDYRGMQVLVTGGTSGIGAGIAAAFHAAGAEVTITGTRKDPADYDHDLSKYRYLQMELTNNEQIDAVAAALPKLDILVNNAGCSYAAENEYEPDIFEKTVKVNLLSVYRLTHALQPKLQQSQLNGGASVIGLASMSSYFGMEMLPGYGAGKAALVQMTKTLAVVWARQNIRVNAVAAGLTDTNATAPAIGTVFSDQLLARTPQNRIGLPRDIAGAVLFLCSGAASFITGQTLPIDGGFSIMG